MSLLLREDRDAVAHLTLNAPDRLNALSEGMIDALQDAFDGLAGDSSIRAIILKGAGSAFCAGHDLKEMTAHRDAPDGGAEAFGELFNRCAAMMQTIQHLPQPVIARVHGIATAAGCQLVASCDLAIADKIARFGVNGVNIGLFCSTPMVALSRNMPRKRVFEMLSTGDFITAPQAVELGLVNRAVATRELDATVNKLAERIAAKLGSAVKIGKQAFYEQLEMPLDQAYAFTGQVMVENMLDKDTREGIDAFLDKRDPNWTQ